MNHAAPDDTRSDRHAQLVIGVSRGCGDGHASEHNHERS
jgi:hypothetical protein